MLKFHKVFKNDGNPESHDVVIEPTPEQWTQLRDSKNLIRDHLRETINRNAQKFSEIDITIGPRFRSQGSSVYKTLVRPAHEGQEIDWDFGVYLPVEIMDENKRIAAREYFNLIENSLLELCRRQGWFLDPGTTKCIRVKIAKWAHIDVPLYVIPAADFHTINERAMNAQSRHNPLRDINILSESSEKGEITFDQWQVKGVQLATRDGEWIETNPEEVATWFQDKVELHTEQLRRVCRYIKSWRDYNWPESNGPTSVSLMILVTRGFVRKYRRDDLALIDAALNIANGIDKDIIEPEITDTGSDFNKLGPKERKNAANMALKLHYDLKLITQFSGEKFATDAIMILQNRFGKRISDKVEFIEVDGIVEAVRSTEPRIVPKPIVGSNQSG